MKTGLRAAVLIVCAAAAAGMLIPAAATAKNINTEAAAAAETAESRAVYTLRSCGNAVSVFSSDEQVPIMQTDINLSSLRKADREMLREGITVESYNDIMSLLEDFGS